MCLSIRGGSFTLFGLRLRSSVMKILVSWSLSLFGKNGLTKKQKKCTTLASGLDSSLQSGVQFSVTEFLTCWRLRGADSGGQAD